MTRPDDHHSERMVLVLGVCCTLALSTVAGRQIWKWSTVATGCHAGCCWIDWEPCLHVKERSASHYCSPCPCTVYHPTPQLAHDHPTQTVCNSGSSHLTTSIISAHELSHDGPACQMSCGNSKTKAVFRCFVKKICDGILLIWSNKWSLFTKLFAQIGCKSRDKSNDAN